MGKIVCETHDNITHLGVRRSRGKRPESFCGCPDIPDRGKSGTGGETREMNIAFTRGKR